jgi:hypothetical protein
MSRPRKFAWIGGSLIIIVLLVAWRFAFNRSNDFHAPKERPLNNPTAKYNPVLSVPSTSEVGQISLKEKTKEEAMQAWWVRREHDKQADWKPPIRFYGRVVDQNMEPVSDAMIHFQWTDLSKQGTSEANALSDANGNFSLSHTRGKNLGVYVTKQGYYTPENVKASAFEFADPGEPNFYEPDPNNPVIFRLRKKGEGAQLVKKALEMVLPGDGNKLNVDLDTGKISPTGELQIQAWKPWPPRPLSPHYDWKVSFTISDGGFVEAPTEFAFEAPEAVYSQPFEFNMPATAGNAWSVSAEKTLYFAFGQPRKYGRLHFRTDGASRYVFVDYVFNPSGSKNLEEASKLSQSDSVR